jgi:hypothetical protein
MLRSENRECPFCGGTPRRKGPKSERVSKVASKVGVQDISAGVKLEFQPGSSKEDYFYCSGCNQEYIWALIDINLILTNFCTDRKEEIADKVRHYYKNQVTLTDLLLKYRTGIVRRHSGTVPYRLLYYGDTRGNKDMSQSPDSESYLSEIDDLIKTGTRTFKYSLSDAILFLLYADSQPIKGKTRQMKEIFLMLTEVMNEQNVEHVNFERKRFGPYSEAVDYTIDQLVFSNYISVGGKKSSNDFAIEITQKARNYIKEKYGELPYHIRQTLERKRKEWDTHIPAGLLNLVYTRYPEYLEKSVFRKRYEPLDWKNDKQRPSK